MTTGLTKSGRPDMRRRENREQAARMPVHEIEQMIGWILPEHQRIAREHARVLGEIRDFREANPELGELEAESARLMEANNRAVLPLWNLLNKMREQAPERHAAWLAYLNEGGPDPRTGDA